MKVSTRVIIALALASFTLALPAHETKEKTPAPGFRPESELASAFVADVKTATIRVYPTIIRTPTNTTFSMESQQQVVAFLSEKEIAKAVSDTNTIDPGEFKGRGQFDWFQNDMAVIGQNVQKKKIDEKYAIVMEVLFPPQRGNNQTVFGIHCIILDTAGQNVFSFLLNSHHQMFVDAAMHIEEGTTETRAVLIRQATAVGMEALLRQLKNALPKQEQLEL